MSAAAAPAAVRERPILFSGDSVRAVLEGRKTQTRRVAKLPPAPNRLGQWEPTTYGGPGTYLDERCTIPNPDPERKGIWHTRTGVVIGCPHGDPGERLWVRETWRISDDTAYQIYAESPASVHYRADKDEVSGGPWRSGRFMFRWASRITLELTAVRVERVQEISDEDLVLEGMGLHDGTSGPAIRRALYRDAWDALNTRRGFPWIANPWVWVLDFRRLP